MLLDSQLRAKIADFGNSHTVCLDPSATPTTFTYVASALDHMPSEAQGNIVQLDPSLDVFSFGHLSLFTVIQRPLKPLFSSSHTDITRNSVARSEVERRGLFITMAECVLLLFGTHPLHIMERRYGQKCGFKIISSSVLRSSVVTPRHHNFVHNGVPYLVSLIKQCLHNYPAQRPRTGDLVAKLGEIQTPGMW